MKRILFIILICLISVLNVQIAKADIMPYYTSSVNSSSMGVYQVPQNFKIYKSQNINSKVLLEVSLDSEAYKCADVSAGNMFLVYLPQRELALITVIDETEE